MGQLSNRVFVALAVLLALVGAGAGARRAGAAPGRAPGSLDPSFGKGGRVLAETIEEVSPSEFTAAAREPNGDLVLEGRYGTLERDGVREIEMRTPTGALVPSFGEGGRVAVESEREVGGGGVATLSNGDIVVGTDECGGTPSSVEMLDPSGAKVASFGQGGCAPALAAEGGFNFEGTAVTTDPQGRILLTGQRSYCPPCGRDLMPGTEAVVARLLPDGSLDPSFGTGGVVGTHATLALEAKGLYGGPAAGVGTTADGGVVLAAGGALVRLDPNGALAPTFGNGGVVSVKGGGTGLSVEPDGSAVMIAGAEFDRAGATVTKFAPDGTPDQSFGEKGTTTLPLPAESSLELVAPMPGGGYLIAGEEAFAKDCHPCEDTPFLERLTAAGRPDPSYGRDGVAVAHLPLGRLPWPATQRGLVVNPDGSAVVAGSNYGQDAYLGGWTVAGAPNASFGQGGGLIEHHEQPAQLEPTGLALTRGGGLTVVSQRSTAPGLITGFKVDFGADGKQLPAPSGAAAVETLAHGAIASLGPGRVAIWTGNENRPAGGLKSAGANGLPVKGFGRRGSVEFPKGFVAEQIASAPGGGVLAVGAIKGKKTKTMAVLRLGPGGHPVHGFGRDGLAEVSFPGGSGLAVAGLVEADGDTVVTGTAKGSVVAVRLLSSGRLDQHFGHGGRVSGLLDGAVGTLIAPWHGGVVVAAASGRLAKGLIRLDARGHLVPGFGRRGVVRKGAEKAPLAVLTGAGRIVVVTNPLYEHGHKGNGVELSSYKADGAVDRAFGRGGVRFYGSGREGRNGWRSFVPVAAVEQPGGKIVVAGTTYSETWLSETDWIERSKAELVRFLVR